MPPSPPPLIDAHRIDPDVSVPRFVRRACHGHLLATISPAVEDHRTATVRLVPEGALVRATCRRCGGHREEVLQLSELDELGAHRPMDYRQPSPELVAYLDETIEPVMEEVARDWYPKHGGTEACSEEVTLASPLLELRDECLRRSRVVLSDGRPLGAHAYLLHESGNRAALDYREVLRGLADVPSGERTRRIERLKAVARQFVARDVGRAGLVGALFLSEVWMAPFEDDRERASRPSRAPDRQEGLMCQVFDQTGGRTRVAPLRSPGEGTREVGDWIHQSWAGGRLTEGLLAPIRTVERDASAEWSPVGLRLGVDGVH